MLHFFWDTLYICGLQPLFTGGLSTHASGLFSFSVFLLSAKMSNLKYCRDVWFLPWSLIKNQPTSQNHEKIEVPMAMKDQGCWNTSGQPTREEWRICLHLHETNHNTCTHYGKLVRRPCWGQERVWELPARREKERIQSSGVMWRTASAVTRATVSRM